MQAMKTGVSRRSTPRWLRRLAISGVYRQIPIYYITNRQTVSAREHGTWPRYSTVMDYELEIAVVTRAPAPHSGRERPPTSSAIRSSTTSRPATGSRSRCRGGSARQGQELRRLECDGALDRHRRRARRSADIQSRSKGQRRDARDGRHERNAVLVRRSSLPTPRRTRRSTRAKCSAPARSAIAADSRSAAF